MDEAIRLFKKQKRPDVVFWILTEYLQDHRIEIPTYNALSTIIIEAKKSIDNEYLPIIHLYLTSGVQDLLDKLFIKEQESFSYNLTKLKRSNETLRLRDIRENIKDYQYFKYLYFQIKKTVDQLNLSHEMIEYYTQFVIS